MKTLMPDQITDADRPYLYARGNADGSVTLYYAEDVVPSVPVPTPAEIDAAQAAILQYQIDAASARSYAKLRALSQMTPAQIQVWVSANVTTLAQAQDAIATLAIAVSVLARRI